MTVFRHQKRLAAQLPRTIWESLHGICLIVINVSTERCGFVLLLNVDSSYACCCEASSRRCLTRYFNVASVFRWSGLMIVAYLGKQVLFVIRLEARLQPNIGLTVPRVLAFLDFRLP